MPNNAHAHAHSPQPAVCGAIGPHTTCTCWMQPHPEPGQCPLPGYQLQLPAATFHMQLAGSTQHQLCFGCYYLATTYFVVIRYYCIDRRTPVGV